MNPYRYQITEHCQNSPYGIENHIVASAATLRGCINQYKKHLKTWELAKVDRKVINTLFYYDGAKLDVVPLD
jgi:hypothetical protein